jgi:hypothetical protein
MSDLPSTVLLQQSHAPPKTGEELEVLGKHAACKFMCGECADLTAAVVETVKSAGLSPEQVKRVVEFANTNAYLEQFKKMGSGHKYVDFPGGPASPGEVIKDLNDGGGGTVFDSGLGDYKGPPVKTSSANLLSRNLEKVANVMGVPSLGDETRALAGGGAPPQDPTMMPQEEETGMSPAAAPGAGGYDPLQDHMKLMHQHMKLMQQATGGGGPAPAAAPMMPKTAEEIREAAFWGQFEGDEPNLLPLSDPWRDAEDLREKLGSAAATVTHELSVLEGQFADTLEGMYQQTKAAALGGVPLGHVLQAWAEVVPGGDYVKTAFNHIGPRLVSEGVFAGLDGVGASLEKTAGAGMVNMEHPLVGHMAAYVTLLDKVAGLSVAREELAQEHARLDLFIRAGQTKEADATRALATLARPVVKPVVEGAIPKLTGAFARAGKAVRPYVERAGEFLMGSQSHLPDIAGTVAEKGLQYAPHAAVLGGGALLGKEVYDRAKYSPIARGVYNAAMARIPYTHQNQIREYQMQMRYA